MNFCEVAPPAIRGAHPKLDIRLGHLQPVCLDLCVRVDRVVCRSVDYWLVLIYEPNSMVILGWNAHRAWAETLDSPCTKTIGDAVSRAVGSTPMKWGWVYRVFTCFAEHRRFIDGLNTEKGWIAVTAFPSAAHNDSDIVVSKVAKRIGWYASDMLGGNRGGDFEDQLEIVRKAMVYRVSDYNEATIGETPQDRWTSTICATLRSVEE